jgi:hypothetical protein
MNLRLWSKTIGFAAIAGLSSLAAFKLAVDATTDGALAFYFATAALTTPIVIVAAILLALHQDGIRAWFERRRSVKTAAAWVWLGSLIAMSAVQGFTILSGRSLPEWLLVLANAVLAAATIAVALTVTRSDSSPIAKTALSPTTKNRLVAAALATAVILGFILRAWNLNYLQGADNFNLMAALSLYENGTYVYNRNPHINYLLAGLFDLFGVSLPIARLPFVVIGTVSIFFTYRLGRIIDRPTGLVAAFLLAVSPVAIEKSSYVREYAEAYLLGAGAMILLLGLVRRRFNDSTFLRRYALTAAAIFAVIYLYSYLIYSGNTKAVLASVIFGSLVVWIIYAAAKLRPYLPAVLLVTAAGFFVFEKIVHIPINVFLTGYGYVPYWLQMFFDPRVQTPMQWFSYSTVRMSALIAAFCLPLLTLPRGSKRRAAVALYGLFFVSVFFLVFKYDESLRQFSRYMFHLYPAYMVLFGLATVALYRLAWATWRKVGLAALTVFLLGSVFMAENTYHGATHDLTIWEGKNPRQPTNAGSRDFYNDILDFLEQRSLTKDVPIVIQGESPFYFTWRFRYPVNRQITITTELGQVITYEAGNNVLMINSAYRINELDRALTEFDRGFLIGHSSAYRQNDFIYRGVVFRYLNTLHKYKIYSWTKP